MLVKCEIKTLHSFSLGNIKDLEVDGNQSCTTMGMYLMLLNSTLKSNLNGVLLMYILPQLKKKKKTDTLSTGLKDPSKSWFPHQHSTKELGCRSVILIFETGSPIILANFLLLLL